MRAFRHWLLLAVMLMAGAAGAQVSPLLNTAYNPPQSRGTVRFFLEDIAKRTGIPFSYSDELVKHRRAIRLKGIERTVDETLQSILAGTGVIAVERGGKILLIPEEAGAPKPPQTVTISGFIRDSASREVLIGAIVYIPALGTGAYTNTYGFYSLTLPPGQWEMVTTSLGYGADTSRLIVSRDTRRDVLLAYRISLAGVTVSSQKDAPADHTHLGVKDLAAHAGLLGENDVMRALQYQPGVQSGAEGSSSVLVRGGDPGQNLNLLDGVPLYYIDHFYGITSIFNTDAVKSVDFYKGAFPSRYGGRLSSIIDVASRDGNMERVSGQASLGLLKGAITLESPIIKDKASVMVSARRTWIDALWRPFFDGFGIDFYDINAKANCIINKNNRVYASFYTGRDQFRYKFNEEDSRARWGNTIGSLRWTSVITPKLFINTTATYSYFRYQVNEQDLSALPDSSGKRPQYTGNSDIYDISLRVQADYYVSSGQHVQVGVQYASADFLPAAVSFGNYSTLSAASFRSNEIVVYAEDELKPSPKWTIRGGLHFATWFSETYKYVSPQPRLYISWKPGPGQQVYGSATKMSQFLHLLSSSTSLLPTDFWLPSTGNIAPERSWLFSLGYSRRLQDNIELNAELYYKDIRELVTYKGAATVFQKSRNWEEPLTTGRGYAYGGELSAKGKWGPFAVSLAYTLSWAWRQFDALNEGTAFPFRYDRRHNIHAGAIFQRRSRFNAIASWTYMSGEAITLPDQLYPDFNSNLPGATATGQTFTYNYSSRNNYRLPPIHRLDIAFNFMRQRGRHFERTWTLGLFNAYGRPNIMAVGLQEETPGQYTLEGLSILRCIPTISYSIKF